MNARDVPSAALTSKAKPLFKHQKQSLLVLKKNKRVFDTSDPGTGKTRVEVEDFAARRRAGGGRALVLATKSLLEAAWQKDFNELKTKLDGESDQQQRPTSGNSKFTETVDC